VSYSHYSDTDIDFLEPLLRKKLFGVELSPEQEINAALAALKFLDLKIPENSKNKVESVERILSVDGYISKEGWVAKPYEYDSLGTFCEGLCLVELNKKWGFINEYGDLAIPIIYDYYITRTDVPGYMMYKGFYKGFCAMGLNGESVWIDKEGNWYD
jgi:hypothetical protein